MDNGKFDALRFRIYKRMIVGAVLGCGSFFATELGIARVTDNMNPVTGLGTAVLAAFGVVVGALLGTLSKQKS
jgi:hypothetical protein